MNANEVIKEHITKNGIKQNFVAEKAGVQPELFRRSLEGKRKIPADEFVRICVALSLDIGDFKNEHTTA